MNWLNRRHVAALAAMAPLVVGDFGAGSRSGWEEKTFRGRTRTAYTMVREGDGYALQAESRGSASGLYRRLDLDVSATPLLRWSWKVAGTLPAGNERRKQGDDYAARVYVVFSHPLPWKTRAIAYIWANRLPAGEALPNPYSDNVRMLAVESGNERAGRWATEVRDVEADYRRLFGERPPKIQAIGIMTDSDDTRGEARGWYGTISLHPR